MVMVPNNITLNNLSRTRIAHTGSRRIARRACNIANHGITDIFRRKIRIFGSSWRIFANNRIFKSGYLKGFLPVLHPFFHVLAQLHRRRRIKVIDDWFYRLH